MKKTTKLLSVLLAVVMLLSCFTMASYAAKAVYQTGANLQSLGAYSPNGAATRFSTEERMSILFDWLDQVLYGVKFDGIHEHINLYLSSADLDITINSVDEICASIDSVKDLLNNGIVSLAAGIGLLGQISDVKLNSWTKGTRRSGAQLSIISQLLNVLKDNASLVDTILANGSINLGSIVGGKVDLSKVNKIIADVPKLIRSKVYPLMSRKDDTKAVATDYFEGNGTPSTVVNDFVNGLFTKAQSTTTYKESANGTCISGHTLPTSASQNLRYYYVKTAASGTPGSANYVPAYFTCYVWNPELAAYEAEDLKFYREEEGEGTGIYTYKTSNGDGLKYYKNGSYWLPSLQAAMTRASNPVTLNVNNESVASIFYKFIPYVFADLAPIALNGFVKQALATWMGATETKIYEGKAGTAEANAVLATLPAGAQTMFNASVPYYQFSYSNYDAEGNADIQYYRYVDKDTNTEEWFEIDMTTGNDFLDLFDMTYTVETTFMDEFVPSSGTATKTLLQSLNKFLCKAAKKVLKSDVYNSLDLDDTGDNTALVPNLRKAAQQLLPLQPDAILGPDYLVHYDGYYQTLVDTSASNDEVFSALAAIIAKALMPQLILPSAANLQGQKVGAVLACVVRELVTQFVPTYNYDALIFSNYNTRTLLTGKDNNYWLDVILTMGVDVGMSYLSNLADLGADKTNGYVVAASKTYTAASFNQTGWTADVDWIIDWALTAVNGTNYEWCWSMINLLDTTGLTVNLASAQDPWTKLDKILNDLLPLKQIINCSAASGKTWLETVLRDKLILGIADLKFEYIFGKGTNYTASGNAGLLSIPSNSVLRTSGTNTGALTQLLLVVRDLINKVIYKVAGSTNLFDTSVFTNINTLNSQTNLRKPVNVLLTKLTTAYSNGLLVTVLPIVEMFVGWKTGSQEYADPQITWESNYTGTGGTKLTIANSSAGMLLKNYKADGTYAYEQAYNLVIDSVSGSGITATRDTSTSATVAPYGRCFYTVKASSAPSSDTATQVVITYHYTGKSGASIGGSQYAVTYLVLSANTTDIVPSTYTNDYNKSGSGTDTTKYLVMDCTNSIDAICMNRNLLETSIKNDIWFKAINKSDDYAFTFNSMSASASSGAWLAVNTDEINTQKAKTVAKGSGNELQVSPFKMNANKTADDFVSGTKYTIGTFSFQAKSSGGNYTNGPSGQTLGDFYFADTGELQELFDSELALNRHSSQYNTSSLYNAYKAAMQNAAVILFAPPMKSTFSTVYAQSNIDTKLAALETAIENLADDAKEADDNSAILEAGLANGETAALIGADDQINFQDFNLYGYWLYENNRTEARNILKEYERPTAPQQYIDGCWLPYLDEAKHEDLFTVINGESNTTKRSAIQGSLEDPSAKDVAAYNQADAEWQMPAYTQLYCADLANKLDYYNDYLIPRSYSKVAAGRVQLQQEIAYAAAQNYNSADYTDVSWARYTDALAAANAANTDGTMQSYVFQAKYDLLVAQRQLRLKAYDWATQIGYAELEALMPLAEGMFANAEYFDAVDGTLDTEWTDLIEALGYTANFGTGNDAWSMNLYENSAEQLISEEIDTRSGRNVARVADVTAKLQAAIDALECTIKVVKNDTTTNVNQEVKFITNLTPGTLGSVADVLTHVTATNPAALLTVTATANGYGTGTTVAATLNGLSLANYYVVIYGDLNGDDVIDGFDAVKADRKLAANLSFSAPLEAAADATKSGDFDVNDVGAIINAAAGLSTINQA